MGLELHGVVHRQELSTRQVRRAQQQHRAGAGRHTRPVPGGPGGWGEGAGVTLCLCGTEEGRLEMKPLPAGEDVWEAPARVRRHCAQHPLGPVIWAWPPSLRQGEAVEHRRVRACVRQGSSPCGLCVAVCCPPTS